MNEIIVKCKYLNKIPLQLIEKVQLTYYGKLNKDIADYNKGLLKV